MIVYGVFAAGVLTGLGILGSPFFALGASVIIVGLFVGWSYGIVR